jgi:hypothetical protein
MKNSLRIFELRNRDQRVIVVIMVILVVAAVIKRYRENRSHVEAPTTTSTPASITSPHVVHGEEETQTGGSPH